MKLTKPKLPIETFTTKEVSEMYGIHIRDVQNRARALCIEKGFLGYYYFTLKQVDEILNYRQKRHSIEVIYVHTTWHILESKMNYL